MSISRVAGRAIRNVGFTDLGLTPGSMLGVTFVADPCNHKPRMKVDNHPKCPSCPSTDTAVRLTAVEGDEYGSVVWGTCGDPWHTPPSPAGGDS